MSNDFYKFTPEREQQLRVTLERLQRQQDSGAWMSESPSDLRTTLGETDRLRDGIKDLYRRATAGDRVDPAELLVLLGSDPVNDSIDAMSRSSG